MAVNAPSSAPYASEVARQAAPGTNVEINASAPGNSFTWQGMQTSVVETVSAVEGENVVQDMVLDIVPEKKSASAEVSAQSEAAAPQVQESHGSPFTPEEELFRTKWGWKAFDDARTAARQAAQQ